MSDKINSAIASDSPAVQEEAADARTRCNYESYSAYCRELDRNHKPFLWRQREILTAIIFERRSQTFLPRLTPAAFCYRSPKDYNDERGSLELLAEAAFAHWECYAEPPCEVIYDLIVELPKAVSRLVEGMEHLHRRRQNDEAKARGAYERSKNSWLEDDDRPPPGDVSDYWQQLLDSVEEYCEESRSRRVKVTSSVPRRASRSGKRRARKEQVLAMLQEGKPRREIMGATGYSASRISQIAGEQEA